MDDDFGRRYRAAVDACERTVIWRRGTPAAHLAALAKAADGVDLAWDSYGERGAVAQLETELVDLLGTEAAVMMPSGVMAQQAVLRVWCDRAG